jgi:hypothetical protein
MAKPVITVLPLRQRLILERSNEKRAVEIKRSVVRKLSKGFHTACEDINQRLSTAEERFPLGEHGAY